MFKHQVREGTFHILVNRALTCSVEDLPIPEPIEEIMATSTFESFDSDLEGDIEEMPEEVSDAEEDSGETSELLATEKPSRPQIELKPLPSGLRYAFQNSDAESLLALLQYPLYPLFILDNGMNLISKSLTVLTPA